MINSIKFEKLSFGYEGSDRVFDHVDFEFPTGKMVWVKAESGSGRSTLLQLLGVLQVPQEGFYYINDQNVTDMTFEEFLPIRMQIGYGFDFGGLINNRTLLDNLTLPILYHKILEPEKAEERAIQYLSLMNIAKFAKKRPAEVSGSVRKLVCLIRSIIHHPQMLLLDDPSVGLQQDVMLKYFDLINQLRDTGLLQHIFISSFDEKLMNLIQSTEVFVDNGCIYSAVEDLAEKKVVHL